MATPAAARAGVSPAKRWLCVAPDIRSRRSDKRIMFALFMGTFIHKVKRDAYDLHAYTETAGCISRHHAIGEMAACSVG